MGHAFGKQIGCCECWRVIFDICHRFTITGLESTAVLELQPASILVLLIFPKVSLAEGHQFDRDVELLVYYEDVHKTSAILETGKSGAAPGEQS